MLTNRLKDNPYCVVLLDEVEKASPTMLNLFLQAFDEGWITDGRGKRVYLSDAIVIMTSNIGSECFRKLTNPLGFLSQAGRRRAGAGRGHARARAALLAGVPQPHRRGRRVPAAGARRGAADRRCSRSTKIQAALARSDAAPDGHAGGARADRAGRLQPRVRRAVPQARDRGSHQAADQPALDRGTRLRRRRRSTARSQIDVVAGSGAFELAATA